MSFVPILNWQFDEDILAPLLIRLSTPILSRTIFSLSSLKEVPAVAISTPVDVAAIVFDTRPDPTRCGLENSAIYALSGRALALV